MFTLRLLPIVGAFAASISSTIGFAAENQHWSAEITGDTVVVRASSETQFRFVQATVTALQEAGLEKFTLRVQKPTYEIGDAKLAFSIRIVDGTAEVTASRDLPHRYLVATINKLEEAGVRKLTIAVAGKSTGEAASR